MTTAKACVVAILAPPFAYALTPIAYALFGGRGPEYLNGDLLFVAMWDACGGLSFATVLWMGVAHRKRSRFCCVVALAGLVWTYAVLLRLGLIAPTAPCDVAPVSALVLHLGAVLAGTMVVSIRR